MLKTELITYNVHARGRKARGQDRNFDTIALAAMINSASVQETVIHGDMLGYFGHWPRLKLGMALAESGVVDGKMVATPIALRTIELSADNDGTIRHRAEFLDTDQGKIAARLFESKAGGFSSAIDAMPGTNPIVPRAFYGFDYVIEPNYSTNRGHKVVLDSIGSEEDAGEFMALLDAAMGESTQAASILNAMFDSLSRQHGQTLEAMGRLARENDELIGRLARGGRAVLDSAVLEDTRIAPMRGNPGEDFERFRHVALERLQVLTDCAVIDTPEANYARARFGFQV